MQQMSNNKGTWRTFSTADGLPGMQLVHLAEDAEGYLWIGTWAGGACRYDGDQFETFTTAAGLPSNRVHYIYLDRRDRLWLVTDDGLCWWDGHTFHHVATEGAPPSFICEAKDGQLYLGGSKLMGYYDSMQERFCDLLPAYQQQHNSAPWGPWPSWCGGIAEDAAGHIWFGYGTPRDAHSMGVVHYDGETFCVCGEESGLLPLAETSYALGADAQGRIWIGGGGHLWRVEDGQYNSISIPVHSDGEPIGIYKMQRDREGRLWFCTLNRGAGVFCCADGELRHLVGDLLPFAPINGIWLDREGLLWFATFGGGLACCDRRGIESLGSEDGLPGGDVIAVDADGKIWTKPSSPLIAKSVVRYDGERADIFDEQCGMALCSALYRDSTHRLLVGGAGLMHYDGAGFHQLLVDPANILVYALDEDHRGQLLLGYHEGERNAIAILKNPLHFARFADGHCEHLFSLQNKSALYISALATARRSGFWFGITSFNQLSTEGAGFGRWSEEEGTTLYTAADGLVSDYVLDLVEDAAGLLWIATTEGISRFDGVSFVNFTTADGLPSNRVHCVYPDPSGQLLFGTEAGAVRYDGQLFQTIRDPQIDAVYDIDQDEEGRYWFATSTGAVRYTPSNIPPQVRIRQLLADKSYLPGDSIQFSTSTRQLVCEYQGMGFRCHPAHMLYRHRLCGRDENWSTPTREMRAFYRDLSPGHYVFAVKAIDRDLNESDPAIIEFDVTRSSRDERIGELEQRVAERTRELEEKNNSLAEANQQFVRTAAVERVRAEALSMRSSDDIANVVAVLWQEMLGLGIETPGASVIFDERQQNRMISYNALPNWRALGLIPDLARVSELSDDIIVMSRELTLEELHNALPVVAEDRTQVEIAYSEGRPSSFRIADGSDILFYIKDCWQGELPADFFATMRGEWIVTNVPFSHGVVSFRVREYSEVHIPIVQELAAALSFGYLRFLDFQKIEQQSVTLAEARDRAETARSAAQTANRAKSEFLANMSHEIRTPMNAILGYAQLLQRDAALSKNQREYIETIEKSGDHLLRLINDVLDLSKIEAGRLDLSLADFDLHKLLQSLATMFALRCQPRQLGWQLSGVGDQPLPVHGDEAKLSQILINLLGNAVKFTREGEVALRFEDLGDNRYRFEIADTGPGIALREQQNLFSAFEQGIAGRDQGGTGLGLSITTSLLELMNSALQLESAQGEGARFSFILALPAAHGELPQFQDGNWSQVRHLKADTAIAALVVDDVRENRQVLASMLRIIGVEVQVAESGAMALEILQKNMPDIVFMDIRMPGMGGLETAKQLWKLWGKNATKVVAISASVLDRERRRYIEAGFNDFIDKPFRSERIYACLADLLEAKYDCDEVASMEERDELNFAGLVLPADLLQRLEEAAELTSVTELEKLLNEVERLGTAEQQLATHLRQLSQDFDMDGVIAALDEINRS